MLAVGKDHYGSLAVGHSISLVAFTLMLVVAAFEARSETESVFTVDTFNSSRLNLIAAAEIAGAFLITQADFLRRLLGTVALTARQWGMALLTAVALLLAWEAGKWIARSRAAARAATAATS
jgi:Ca2+-transporting ATPase